VSRSVVPLAMTHGRRPMRMRRQLVKFRRPLM
jgi:hypothetical protein